MAEVTRTEVVEMLMKVNPGRRQVVEMYVANFLTFVEAEDNILRNGNIVAHPRTGAPMENPYLRVRSIAQKNMGDLKLRVPEELWERVRLGGIR